MKMGNCWRLIWWVGERVYRGNDRLTCNGIRVSWFCWNVMLICALDGMIFLLIYLILACLVEPLRMLLYLGLLWLPSTAMVSSPYGEYYSSPTPRRTLFVVKTLMLGQYTWLYDENSSFSRRVYLQSQTNQFFTCSKRSHLHFACEIRCKVHGIGVGCHLLRPPRVTFSSLQKIF